MQAKKFKSDFFEIDFGVQSEILFKNDQFFALWKQYQSFFESGSVGRKIEGLLVIDDLKTVYFTQENYIHHIMNLFAHFVAKTHVLNDNAYQELITFHEFHVFPETHIVDPSVLQNIFNNALQCKMYATLGSDQGMALSREMFNGIQQFAQSFGFISNVFPEQNPVLPAPVVPHAPQQSSEVLDGYDPTINPFDIHAVQENPWAVNPHNPVHGFPLETYTNSSDASGSSMELLPPSYDVAVTKHIPQHSMVTTAFLDTANYTNTNSCLETEMYPVPGSTVVTETFILNENFVNANPMMMEQLKSANLIDVFGPDLYKQCVTVTSVTYPEVPEKSVKNNSLDRQILQKVLDETRTYIRGKTADKLTGDTGDLRAKVVKKILTAKGISTGCKYFLVDYFFMDTKDSRTKGTNLAARLTGVVSDDRVHIMTKSAAYFERRKANYPNMNMMQVAQSMFERLMANPKEFLAKADINDSHVLPPSTKLKQAASVKTFEELASKKDSPSRIVRACLRGIGSYLESNQNAFFKDPDLINQANALKYLCTMKEKNLSQDFLMVIMKRMLSEKNELGAMIRGKIKPKLNLKFVPYLEEASGRYRQAHKMTPEVMEAMVTTIFKKMKTTPLATGDWKNWSEASLTAGYVNDTSTKHILCPGQDNDWVEIIPSK